ncbi:MAG: hypothetical protein U9R15_21160 [Chloroflexota bacterium]|nr:hypothetical protein [Chloroflexota bacterium]
MEIIPDDWQDVVYQEIATDEKPSGGECIVFYRAGDPSENPIDAVAYRLIWDRYPDTSNKTPSFVAYDLEMPPDDYMCQCECKTERADLLSAYEGPELIIQDKCEEKWTRLHAYRWVTETMKYELLAHFDGDLIAWEPDQVTVDNYTLGGAGLVFRCIYSPREGALPFNEKDASVGELIFPDGLPDDVLMSPYPEVIVLAFYSHVPYADTTAIQGYFAGDAWQSVGQCEDGKCGCPTKASPIAKVRVTNMDVAESRQVISPTSQYCPPDEAITAATSLAFVTAEAVCEYEGDSEEAVSVIWTLAWKGGRWRLQGSLTPSDE